MALVRIAGRAVGPADGDGCFELATLEEQRVSIDGSAAVWVPQPWTLAAGETVEVFGDVTKSAFDEHREDLRAPAAPVPLAIKARIVAGGPGCARRMDAALTKLPLAGVTVNEIDAVQAAVTRRRPTDVLGSVLLAGFAILLAAATIAMVVQLSSKERPTPPANLAAYVALMVTNFIFWWPAGHPTFRVADRAWAGVSVLTLVLVGAPVTISAWGLAALLRQTTSPVEVGVYTSLIGLLLVVRFGAYRAAQLPLVRLLGAQRDLAFEKGTIGAWEGVIRDQTPIEVRGVAVAVVSADVHPPVHRGYSIRPAERRFDADAGFQLETPQGTLELDPRSVEWASTVTSVGRDADAQVIYTLLPVGGRAVVWGKLERVKTQWHLHAHRGRAALLLATEPDDDPLRVARTAVRSQGAVLTLMAGCLMLSLAIWSWICL